MSNLVQMTTREVMPEAALLSAFADFLKIDIADARPDTVRTYKTHVAQWVVIGAGRGALTPLRPPRGT